MQPPSLSLSLSLILVAYSLFLVVAQELLKACGSFPSPLTRVA